MTAPTDRNQSGETTPATTTGVSKTVALASYPAPSNPAECAECLIEESCSADSPKTFERMLTAAKSAAGKHYCEAHIDLKAGLGVLFPANAELDTANQIDAARRWFHEGPDPEPDREPETDPKTKPELCRYLKAWQLSDRRKTAKP